MKPLALFAGLLILLAAPRVAPAQTDRRIEEQRRVVAALEKKIAAEEREISKIRQGRNAAEEKARRLARQLESRSRLLDETTKQERLLHEQLDRSDSTARALDRSLARVREHYAETVREAYRNYRHNNYLTYLFSSRDFTDAARRMALLRQAAARRSEQLAAIDSLSRRVAAEKAVLENRRQSLDSVAQKLRTQREGLQRDAHTARANVKQMSRREQEALRRKVAQEEQLTLATDELRRLTKGNTEGASFSARTTGLRLPVAGGKVQKYKGNMAEITGPRGAHVLSIYDGRIVNIKRNKVTNKHDVYIAHGEYLTTYTNLGSVCCEKGDKVVRNQRIGTVGPSVDILTMETEYKIVFGIFSPKPNETMRAENCFRR